MQKDCYGFRSRRALEDHFRNHYDDPNGGFSTIDEYGECAQALLTAPVSDDILDCIRTMGSRSGMRIRYHKINQGFIVINTDGYVVSYYRRSQKKKDQAENLRYFRNQCQQ